MNRCLTKLRFVLCASALALLGSGCATLTEGECHTADWHELGRMDGRQGYERARLYEHQKACAEYGVQIDASAYYRGRRVGLASYCTQANGYDEGRAGHTYRGVCPAKDEQRFLAAYRDGKLVHDVIEDIEEVERDIDRQERILDDDESTSDARRDARRELRLLYDQLRRLNHERNRLERTMMRYRY
ncbi:MULTISPECIES: DUF2799 domain-containing protein [unclassified Guyparkeria]|uniref:DUF2799 domain-containing protein n=1 Tax=unclassified Guyparkeria TaxID=2626246 RepID=UPI00073396AB|nr:MULTISPECIES: DUF2799 domain-containing protein [unclassified Guyparkeria]KTG15908.1 hypothetical protein AUR63_06220 [Guyparkeria sp. XI15]OAE84658.1 hypothetical protein AWR35_06230 [Guyparkeria sp. WRN-7]